MTDPAPTNGYCSLAEFRAQFYDQNQTAYTTDDTAICAVITAVSRAIDAYCGRTFYARTETRYFDVPGDRELRVDDDLLTVTTLTNGDATAIASSDYDLIPKNLTPKYGIRLKASSSVSWELSTTTYDEIAITVAGTWGYSATAPADVKQACIIQSMRIFKRKDAPFGIAGAAEMGQSIVIPKLDPDVGLILAPYRRRR
jgi:hypothetical protein